MLLSEVLINVSDYSNIQDTENWYYVNCSIVYICSTYPFMAAGRNYKIMKPLSISWL